MSIEDGEEWKQEPEPEDTGPDSMDWTPGAMLRELADICDNEDVPACVAIALDDSEGYSIRFRNAGLKCSEVLALLEVARAQVLETMGY